MSLSDTIPTEDELSDGPGTDLVCMPMMCEGDVYSEDEAALPAMAQPTLEPASFGPPVPAEPAKPSRGRKPGSTAQASAARRIEAAGQQPDAVDFKDPSAKAQHASAAGWRKVRGQEKKKRDGKNAMADIVPFQQPGSAELQVASLIRSRGPGGGVNMYDLDDAA